MTNCDENNAANLWIPVELLARTIRAEFRVLYFIHGRNTQYNYQVMRQMFVNGSESSSMIKGIVRLRALNDDTVTFDIPLYASELPAAFKRILQHMRLVNKHMPQQYNSSRYAARYLMTNCAFWAYWNSMVTGTISKINWRITV